MDDKPQASQTEFRRQTAFKCSISDINKGMFVRKPGWESNYVMTDYGDFSRINIISVVISREDNSLVLDDGSGQLVARFFEKQIPEDIDVGHVVIIIGRPREFNAVVYLSPEIIKNIDKRWISYRKKELSLIKKIRDVSTLKTEKRPEPQLIESETTMNSKERIIKLISELDSGQGAEMDNIIRLSKIGNCEEILNDMIMKGEIYEIRPGKIKIIN